MFQQLWKNSIVRRGVTICTVAPTVLFLISNEWTMAVLVWALSYSAMLEWTAMKRHLKVALLHKDPDGALARVEYPTPVARTNLFIIVKCLACSFMCLTASISQAAFHLAMATYFLFWVIFTLVGQNKAELTAETARKKIGSPTNPTQASVTAFNQMELTILAENFTTEVFLSFCLEYFGFVWVTGLAHSLLMYAVPGYGQPLVVTILVSNWANDIAALIVGRTLKGRTSPLYPRISPNKSREGAIAGVIANGVVAAALMEYLGAGLDFGSAVPRSVLFMALGVAFGLLGVLGDLLQSLFKRSARLKDTGAVFPGHGGVLDRIDGLLVVYPVAYWMLWLFLQTR